VLDDLGLRIGEVLRLDVDALSYNRGQRTVRFVGMGGNQRGLAQAAGLPAAARLSPHSLRHAFATTARQAGIAHVQDAMGHADPRTTRRYDRDRHNLDRDPAHELAKRRASRRTRAAAPTHNSEHGTA
jgi:integrase